ncbi:unnamed protein product [Candidula unifasciata]|uniref:Metallothionein n=1 Tax=Candidula unifasciata TaxID=100452 RepID=A0A8S3YX03_9EUPU|nr:unnamed protein product [Candidula unifasciata]
MCILSSVHCHLCHSKSVLCPHHHHVISCSCAGACNSNPCSCGDDCRCGAGCSCAQCHSCQCNNDSCKCGNQCSGSGACKCGSCGCK